MRFFLLLFVSFTVHAAEDPGAATNTLRERWNRLNQIGPPEQKNSCTKAVGKVSAKLSGAGLISNIKGKDEYTLCFWNGPVVEGNIAPRLKAIQQTGEIMTLKHYHERVSNQMALVQASLKADGGNICGASAAAKAAIANLDDYLQCADKTKELCDTQDFEGQVRLITELKDKFVQIVGTGSKPQGDTNEAAVRFLCRNANKGAKEAMALFVDAEKKCATTLGYMKKTMSEVHQLKQSLGTNCN